LKHHHREHPSSDAWAEPFHDEWLARVGRPCSIRLAHAIAAQWLHTRPRIVPGDLIVGTNPYQPADGLASMVRWSPAAGIVFDGPACERLQSGQASQHEHVALVMQYWEAWFASRRPRLPSPHRFPGDFELVGRVDGLAEGDPLAWHAALDGGINGLRDKCRSYRKMNARRENAADWYDALQIVLDGVSGFIEAHADAAERAAESDETNRVALLEAAAICRRIAHDPPASFREAAQLFYFLFLLAGPCAPGRLDHVLGEYLAAELRDRTIKRTAAQSIVDCLWRKLGENGAGEITLGGSNADHSDASNALTEMLLQSANRSGSARPAIALRWHPGTPRKTLPAACRSIVNGVGCIRFLNDDPIVAAMSDRAPADHARDYAVAAAGRIRPSGWSGGCRQATLNAAKLLELTLHDGRDAISGQQLGPETGQPADLDSFEKLEAAFRKQIDYAVEVLVRLANQASEWSRDDLPFLPRSLLTFSCIEKGLDLLAGGADCGCTTIDVLGLATSADSLAAISRLACDRRVMTLPELVSLLDTDFDGAGDDLRRTLDDLPRCRTLDPEALAMLARLREYIADSLKSHHTSARSPWTMEIIAGCDGDACGQHCAATPDGRRRGSPLADTVVHSDLAGALKCARKLGTDCSPASLDLCIRLARHDLAGRTAHQRIAKIVTTWMEAGGRAVHVAIAAPEPETDHRPAEQSTPDAKLAAELPGISAGALGVKAGKTHTRRS